MQQGQAFQSQLKTQESKTLLTDLVRENRVSDKPHTQPSRKVGKSASRHPVPGQKRSEKRKKEKKKTKNKKEKEIIPAESNSDRPSLLSMRALGVARSSKVTSPLVVRLWRMKHQNLQACPGCGSFGISCLTIDLRLPSHLWNMPRRVACFSENNLYGSNIIFVE